LNNAIKRNYFETALHLASEYYTENPKRASNAESTVRHAIEHINKR